MNSSRHIVCVNAGSSSIKFARFGDDGGRLDLVDKGEVEGIGSAPRFVALDGEGHQLAHRDWSDGAGFAHEAFLGEILDWIDDHGGGRIVAAGHRVVHGGTVFSGPVRLDERVLAELDRLVPLAPLHQPHNLAVIRALTRLRPELPQIACFDTAFHRSLPAVAARFALPREFEAAGLRRYGFHGLSYEYIASELANVAPAIAAGRVVVAHLGNGASLCAMQGGRSVDTTMGLTPLDGLPMGTRCGALDPGVVLWLLRQRGMPAQAIEDLLYRRSGLLGVSGISSDMRALLASPDPRAGEAVDLFVFRIARELGAFVASLGGIDGLVFTGGIGEHAASIRARVCARASAFGIELDRDANDKDGPCITARRSRVSAWVIPTDEDLMIARHVRAVLHGAVREDATMEPRDRWLA